MLGQPKVENCPTRSAWCGNSELGTHGGAATDGELGIAVQHGMWLAQEHLEGDCDGTTSENEGFVASRSIR
jgi:hypothetical protein